MSHKIVMIASIIHYDLVLKYFYYTFKILETIAFIAICLFNEGYSIILRIIYIIIIEPQYNINTPSFEIDNESNIQIIKAAMTSRRLNH